MFALTFKGVNLRSLTQYPMTTLLSATVGGVVTPGLEKFGQIARTSSHFDCSVGHNFLHIRIYGCLSLRRVCVYLSVFCSRIIHLLINSTTIL